MQSQALLGQLIIVNCHQIGATPTHSLDHRLQRLQWHHFDIMQPVICLSGRSVMCDVCNPTGDCKHQMTRQDLHTMSGLPSSLFMNLFCSHAFSMEPLSQYCKQRLVRSARWDHTIIHSHSQMCFMLFLFDSVGLLYMSCGPL